MPQENKIMQIVDRIMTKIDTMLPMTKEDRRKVKQQLARDLRGT
jgi:hypothetical protein